MSARRELAAALLPNGTPLDRAKELTVLAMLVWGEARGEAKIGKRAVAHVVMNRWLTGLYGKSPRDVMLKPWQFSCFNQNERHKFCHIALDNAWIASCAEAYDAYMGISQDPTIRATHFFAPRAVRRRPGWASKILFTVTIGNHEFYREHDWT